MKRLLFLFFTTNLLFAQGTTGVLKGKVTDETTGEPLYGAYISIINQPSQSSSTNFDGDYILELKTGVYQIACSFIGMESDTQKVVIEADQILNLNFELTEPTLQEIVVSSGGIDQNILESNHSMETISPRDLEKKNIVSAEQALDSKPGVNILDGEPQIRGGSGFTFGVGSRVAIIVDGMPLLTGDAGRPEWNFIPIENVRQIEVIKGATSVLYGSNALSGVISIESAYPTLKPITKVTTNVGIWDSPSDPNAKWWNGVRGFGGVSFLHSQIVKKNLDVIVGGNFFYDMSYLAAPLIPEDAFYQDSTTNFSDDQIAKARGRLNFNLRWRSKKIEGLSYGINANAMYNKTNFVLAWQDDSTNIMRAYPGAIALQEQTIFHVDPYISLHRKNYSHKLKMRFFLNDNKITNDMDNSSEVYFGEYRFTRKFQFIDGLNFTGGIVGSHSRSSAQLYTGSGGNNNFINNAAGYIQLDKKFWNKLNLSAGIRMEYFDINGSESVFQPVFRSGMSFEVFKGTYARFSYGQGYRYPTIAEKFILLDLGAFAVYPNIDLKPETSDNFELGIKQGFKFKDKLLGYIDIAGFQQNFDNTIEYLFGVWGNQKYGFKFLNTGRTKIQGLDVSGMVQIKLNKNNEITLMGGYTYVLPRAVDPDFVYAVDSAANGAVEYSFNNTSLATGDEKILKYRFRHSAKFDFDYFFKKFGVGVTYRYYSYMENVDAALEELELTTANQYAQSIRFLDYRAAHQDGTHIIDARISFQLNDNIKFGFVANNVMNNLYSMRPMKIEAPRSFALQYVQSINYKKKKK